MTHHVIMVQLCKKKKKKKKKKGLKLKKLNKAWTKKVKHKPQRKLIRISFKITTAVQIARIWKQNQNI